MVTDITERLDAEQALRQERNFLSTLLDTTDALMLVLDCDWRIVRFNRACQKASGYDEAEVLGRPFWELGLIPETELPAVEVTAQGTRAGRIHDYWENHWRHRNGELRLISWSSSFIRDEGGDIEYLIGTGTDITDRRRAEEQLKQWQTRLVHMDRLATAAEMASGLAHELNQPLTAIGNYSDVALMLIKASDDPDGKLSHLIEQMDRQAQRAGSIIRHLRDFVGKAGSDSAWVDINTLVREMVEFVEADIRRTGAEIRLELADALPRLWLEPVQIEQVLVNLVRNACEAMEAAASEPRQLTLRTALAEGERIQVSVRDTGPGVDPVIREQLFRPFETTKPQGLGMGLAISRSIVEARGGRLWLEGGAGTAFHFTLPYSPPERPDAQRTAQGDSDR
ncbi:sensor histidine kinase [Marinobacterium aestuariivivens]|uniref:histidine kinase n=1 Tax=Marinobacterium aestuariivivens TaxID=1698799 RepID=A0ABW2A6R0_9GAMM